ncbi:hypothetical protein 162322334 [Organic Lake phycodnavirus 1]|nr:hypothetical protein 162322334 [Organic Lake phycodnavirus 1]
MKKMQRNIYHGDMYSLQTSEEVPLDGVIIPSIYTLNNLLSSSKMNSLLNQIEPTSYIQDNYVLGSKEYLFTKDHQILHKDKPFYSFLDDIIPNMENILPYIDSKLYNIYDYVRKLSLFHLYELNQSQYNAIQKLVHSNIKYYNSLKRLPMLNTPKTYKTNAFFMNSILTLPFKEEFYSNSELFQSSLYENHTLLFYDLFNPALKETNVKNLMTQLNANKEANEETYDKIYNNEDEKDADILPIFRDLATGLSSISLLWNKIDTTPYKNEKIFENEIKKYLNSSNKTQQTFYKDDAIIQAWYKENVILTGMLCFVKDKQKPYVFQNNSWVPYVEKELVKDSLSINKSLNQQLNDITKREGLRKTHFGTREENIRHSTFIYKSNQTFFKKYNDIKKTYSDLYVSYGVVSSPHQPLFDKILQIDELEKKMKLIRHFCDIYTMEGLDPQWLYCIDSGNKLVPLFMKTLAYSNLDLYQETIEKICYDQGEQQDEYWVDKYSGYTIKKINFNDEEGFTSDGFKMKTRDIIQESGIVNLSETDKNIQTILRALGVHYEHLNHISDEYNKVKKEFAKINIIILYAVIFIFIQANINTDNIKSSFFSCKTSFSGYPASKNVNETSGIDYILCVHKALTQSKKLFKKDQFIMLIDVCLKHSPSLRLKLSANKNKPSVVEKPTKKWDLFLPRLTKITSKKIKNNYYRYFEFQKNIHEYVNDFEPNVKLMNGQYKIFNNYSSIKDGVYVLPDSVSTILSIKDALVKTYLQYYRSFTKNDNKFPLTKPVYSNEKKKRILKEDYSDDLDQDSLNSMIKKKLLNKRKWKEAPIVKETEEEHTFIVSKEKIKQYKTEIDNYMIKINKSKLYKLLDNMKSNELSRVKYFNRIFKNIWDDLWMISHMNENIQTYKEATLRKKILRILNQKHIQVLKQTIQNTYEDLTIPKETYDLVPEDIHKYSLKEQSILYKYALCEAYKHSTKVMKYKIDKTITPIIQHLNINVNKIEHNNDKERRKEKKDMTDMFKSLNESERKAEFLMKQHKLGQWNVGKEVYVYKAEAYDENTVPQPMDQIEEITEYEEYMDNDNE